MAKVCVFPLVTFMRIREQKSTASTTHVLFRISFAQFQGVCVYVCECFLYVQYVCVCLWLRCVFVCVFMFLFICVCVCQTGVPGSSLFDDSAQFEVW